LSKELTRHVGIKICNFFFAAIVTLV